jgi:FkbM family methyltransferase
MDLQLAFIRGIAKRRRTRAAAVLARGARAYLNAYGNWDFDAATNGEQRVLRIVAGASPTCIFDVGANEGEWTEFAAGLMPQAAIHAFELIPDTAERLRARVAGTRAVVHAMGLGAEETTLDATFFPESSQLSGINPLPHALATETRRVRVTTGDAYCAEHGIEHIDLLKVDTEGHDFDVLRGFEAMFARGGIDVVQFEYGRGSILTRRLLLDHYELLEGHGFVVGKVFPEHVEFRAYDLARDEDFLGPNYLAVRSARADLVSALRG